jgi:predicted transcriptional regulator
MLARKLLGNHQMKQTEVAELLGISQSAVSKYSKKVRGTTLAIENFVEIQAIMDQIVNFLLNEPSKKTEVMKLFCQACSLIRKRGVMCPFCQQNAPKAEKGSCDFCTSP